MEKDTVTESEQGGQEETYRVRRESDTRRGKKECPVVGGGFYM